MWGAAVWAAAAVESAWPRGCGGNGGACACGGGRGPFLGASCGARLPSSGNTASSAERTPAASAMPAAPDSVSCGVSTVNTIHLTIWTVLRAFCVPLFTDPITRRHRRKNYKYLRHAIFRERSNELNSKITDRVERRWRRWRGRPPAAGLVVAPVACSGVPSAPIVATRAACQCRARN